MTLVEDGDTDFIQDHQDRCRDHRNWILWWERMIELNLEYSMGKLGFIASMAVSKQKSKWKHQG